MFRLFALLSLSFISLTYGNDPLRNVASGLTYASCINNDACRGDRECIDENTQEGCSDSNNSACVCVPPEFTPCTNSGDCELGEYCGAGNWSPAICVGRGLEPIPRTEEQADDISNFFSPLDCSFEDTESVDNGNALSYERCEGQGACKGTRQCVIYNLDFCCSSPITGCICAEPLLKYCASNSNCNEEGEVCLRSRIAAPRCVSREARTNFNGGKIFEGARAVCVDAKLLKGVEKVFEKDQVAKVLCDRWDQCATKGHMVTWGDGKVGMWKTYCEESGGCTEAVKMVNSPKWKRGLRVEGKDVSFTAFAARWESKTEERLLRGVMRMGM